MKDLRSTRRMGFFETIGNFINGVGHTVAMGEELAISGHRFTEGLPELAGHSSDLMNAKAQQALDEQRKLIAPSKK